MRIGIKVGDKFRVALERYTLYGAKPEKFDTTRVITVTKVGLYISYRPQMGGLHHCGSQRSVDFQQYLNDGFLVRHDVQEDTARQDKATALNTDNAVCNKCGRRTKGLFSEFSGPRYCPECEK
jgi:hypothetical protein